MDGFGWVLMYIYNQNCLNDQNTPKTLKFTKIHLKFLKTLLNDLLNKIYRNTNGLNSPQKSLLRREDCPTLYKRHYPMAL